MDERDEKLTIRIEFQWELCVLYNHGIRITSQYYYGIQTFWQP